MVKPRGLIRVLNSIRKEKSQRMKLIRSEGDSGILYLSQRDSRELLNADSRSYEGNRLRRTSLRPRYNLRGERIIY